MRIREYFAAALVAALAVPAAANADVTLGNATMPVGSASSPCPTAAPPQIVASVTGSASTNADYTYMGSAPMALTQWQINADGATAGTQVVLVVMDLTLGASPALDVVATDTETLPASLPPTGIATFTPSSPLVVQPGDSIALYISGTTGLTCAWTGGSIANDAEVAGFEVASPPVAGQAAVVASGNGVLDRTAVGNLAATLVPLSYDAGLSLSSGPSNATVGQPALLFATLTNNGPIAGAVTFTDPVPYGLTVDYAGTSAGSCTINPAVNIVSCTLPDLSTGKSATVGIVVTPAAAGSYADPAEVSLESGATDPNPANNGARTTLTVGASSAPTGGASHCVVPRLSGTSESLAKSVLGLLGCDVGAVKVQRSKSVAKGDVISTSPGRGTYAAGETVGIVVSSGKPPQPKKRKRK